MAKFLLGILSGVVLTVLTVFAMILVAATFGTPAPSVEEDSVLTIRLQGDIPEYSRTDFSFEFMRSGPPPTLLDLRDTLHHAAGDDRIRALLLDFRGLAIGWGKAQEIRWAVETFKKSGKPVFAFLSAAATSDYYIASAADRIFMPPEGVLDVKGLRVQATFYTDTLKKLGIEAELERIGKYKSAVESMTRTSMSDEYREVMNSILDDVYTRFVETVAPARGKTPEALLEILDQGPFIPPNALKAGLVDALLYADQVDDHIQEKLELEELIKVKFSQYSKSTRDLAGGDSEDEIAIVYAEGQIMRGSSEDDPFFGATVLGSDSFAKTIREVRDKEAVKAVILRINSPGGDAVASDLMWREVRLLREKKPVIVSMSDVAASGGYYIAMADDTPVLAYAGTYTGSIGVFFGKINLRGFYDKIGIKKETLTRGRYADINSDYRSLTEDERRKLRSDIEVFYKNFVEKVAQSRNRDWDQIHEVAQGRVWLGSQALEQGLVDELGGLDRAIELARAAAEIDEEAELKLVPYPAPKNIFESLIDPETWTRETPLPAALRSKLAEIPNLVSLLQGGMLRIAPYSITVE